MKISSVIRATLAAIILSGVVGCKTNSENYRVAYEGVKDKVERVDPVQGTIYDRYRQEARSAATVIDGDTIPTLTVPVMCVKGLSTPDDVLPYSIAVTQFKQIFNARALVDRLRAAGYRGATVVQTAEPLYYVIAVTTATASEAAAAYELVRADRAVFSKPPFPLILRPTRYPLTL